MSNCALNVLKLLFGSVRQTSRRPSGSVMRLFWPPREQLGLAGYGRLATQTLAHTLPAETRYCKRYRVLLDEASSFFGLSRGLLK